MREIERGGGRGRQSKGKAFAAAEGGCDVRQRGAIIVSGFHRAMITLTAEMAHNKRTLATPKCAAGREDKKKKTENRNGNRSKKKSRQTYLQFPQLKYPTLAKATAEI